MRAKQILTDPNHFMTELEVFPTAEGVTRANTLEVSTDENINFKGFGVALTGSSCYNLSLMDEKERTELLKSIYSKDGVGLSVARLSIGSSDYSAELYSYDDVPFDTELEHFSIERDMRYVIPMIKEVLKINPDLFLFASPWSPPGWMKTGGNMCGGYMRSKYVDCYAEYIVKFIKAYAENGIKISAITPQNEPEVHHFGVMPSCIWHPEIEGEFIKILKNKLNENNLDVEIWMYDHSFAGAERVMWAMENCDIKDSCKSVAMHYYDGSIEETLKIKRAYPDVEIHFTEAGPRLFDNYGTDWCKWGIMMAKTLKCGYSSFTGWNLMLNELGGPNIGPFWCGGLITRNTDTGELSYSGQYKAFSHIARYITPKSKIYGISVGENYNLHMTAYPKPNNPVEGFGIDNNDGKFVAVLINPNTEKRQTQFKLNDNLWYVELPPDSISTVIINEV